MKTILISNDDGIHSPGIKILARILKKIPQTRIIVVAPDREQSAASHALTLHRPLRYEKIASGFYAVEGTPTDSVMMGVHVIYKAKPDLIVSGINRGANLGEDVHYSGTVSAAMEGAIMGVPAIAISLIAKEKLHYETASGFAVKLARKILKVGLPSGMMLNVNVPNLPPGQIKGCAITRLGKHHYGDVMIEKTDPRGRPYYWIGGNPHEFEERADSDFEACYLRHMISVTPIKSDLTDTSFLKEMRKWKL